MNAFPWLCVIYLKLIILLLSGGGCQVGCKELDQVEVSSGDQSADSVATAIITDDPHTVLVEFSSMVADTQEYIIKVSMALTVHNFF